MKRWAWWLLLAAAIAAFRLCHSAVLWPEETLPLAAAVQMLYGRQLYSEIWFDKPPLAPAVCLLWGARPGWPLRVAGALYVLAACWLAGRLTRCLWGEREGKLAAGLLAFFLTFWLPAAVIPLASDLLMLVPHAAAVWMAVSGRPFASGLAAGVAFQANPKGLLVLAACLLFRASGALRILAGFLLPSALVFAWLAATGSFDEYCLQVWRLGTTYARDTFLQAPLSEGLVRTGNWAGFHAALLVGAAAFWRREQRTLRLRFAAWMALGLAGAALGLRFFPRYYFLALLPLTVAGARGLALLERRTLLLAVLALLVPLARFAPRYLMLAEDLVAGRAPAWRDVALDRDSREMAALIRARARAGETLFVWGYRPELYVYTRLPAASRFLECQPLTGVFADRHLFESRASHDELARKGRRELVAAQPTWLVDGLSLINPALAMDRYPELRPWLAAYRAEASTSSARLYRRQGESPRPEGTRRDQASKTGAEP
ncbi:MAG: hypothetical protein RMI94_03550 [Bryobacterales bacterium]|nr:hypothetical protein [Bryobacteraceae bacterium]MDW8129599.1 hypothetical protein [Bryobacterales bacterium]